MQAHILGEVGILGTVLLRVSSRKILPIFIEIGSYLTDKGHKLSYHSFLRHGVHATCEINIDEHEVFYQQCRYTSSIAEITNE